MKNRYQFFRLYFIVTYFFLFFFSGLLFAQPFSIGHTTVTFVDASRSNRNIPTEIYYPSNVAGDNVPISTTVTEKFPLLVFGHGFLMTWDAYRNLWESFVPQGYIMVFPKTESSLSPSHLNYGKDLAFVLDQMNSLGNQGSGIFASRVSNMNAIMGHSMGGGAAFLAAQLNANCKTLVTLAAAETNPSAVAAASTIAIPSLTVAGANDCVAPAASNQILMYGALASSCKTYISITGASHCQMADSNFFCNLGEGTCSPAPTISANNQHIVLNNYLISWFQSQLKLDCDAGVLFNTTLENDSRITFQKTCSQCDPLIANSFYSEKTQIFPNPFQNELVVTNDAVGQHEIKIYDSISREVASMSFTKSLTIPTELWASGIYFYVIDLFTTNLERGVLVKK